MRRHSAFPSTSTTKTARNRRENITDWALQQFREHYKDKKINKWDIFHYVYGLLHHPGYREKFADNLKRELPRIPLRPRLPGLRQGRQEAGRAAPRLRKAEALAARIRSKRRGVPLSYRVEERCGSPRTRRSLNVNPSLTLAGIPPEVFEYRLGNRCALDWVIDQYQVSTDKRSGITKRPQPRRRRRIHRPPRRPGRSRQRGDGEDCGGVAEGVYGVRAVRYWRIAGAVQLPGLRIHGSDPATVRTRF